MHIILSFGDGDAYESERVFYSAFFQTMLLFFLAKRDKGHGVAKRAVITSRIIIAYSFEFTI